jgi:hypothetical protein
MASTSATITCSANANCNPDGSYKTSMSFLQPGGGTFAMFQLLSRTRYDTQIFSQYTR